MKRAGEIALMAVAIAALGGCAGTRAAAPPGSARAVLAFDHVVDPGLANAPALPRAETIDVHDVIANGHDSCPRGRVAGRDPLFERYPPCAGLEKTPASVTLIGTPALPPEPRVWDLHLHGLPPCEGARGESSEEVASALCSSSSEGWRP